MSNRGLSMRAGNKGLTVRVNLWALNDFDGFDSESARLWIKGSVTNADTSEEKKFNDAGELISILGKWNSTKLRNLKKQ